MNANFTSKGIALAGISVLTAGLIASGTVVTEAYLFKIKEASAAIETAKAEMQKAIAAQLVAKAAELDAKNKLTGTENAAAAVIAAAQLEAGGMKAAAQVNSAAVVAAAQHQAGGIVRAAQETAFADNAVVRDLTGPIFLEPVKKIVTINDQLGQLRAEVASGIDFTTRGVLSDEERGLKRLLASMLQLQLAGVQATASKNVGDTIGLMMDGITRGFGNVGSAYPSGNEPIPVRRIVQDR